MFINKRCSFVINNEQTYIPNKTVKKHNKKAKQCLILKAKLAIGLNYQSRKMYSTNEANEKNNSWK